MSQASETFTNLLGVDSQTQNCGTFNVEALQPKTNNIKKYNLTKCFSGIRNLFFSAVQKPAQVSTDLMDVSFSKESWQNRLYLMPQRKGINSLLMFLLSFCLPICPALAQIGSCEIVPSEKPNTITICLPGQQVSEKPPEKPKDVPKPVGMITQNKEMELNNGKLIFGCSCGKRNGLAGEDCPRSCCRNNPGCTMIPPMCWPQFKEPPEPPKVPEQKLMIVPVELVYVEDCETE